MKIESRLNNNERMFYYAENLNDSRANFFVDKAATRFNMTYSSCETGKKLNHLGECVWPIILCSDFNSEIARGKQACEVKRDGVPIFCKVVDTRNECTSFHQNICTNLSNYLNHQTQLMTTRYVDEELGSKVCTLNIINTSSSSK